MVQHKVSSDWDARVYFEGAGEVERRLEVTPAIAGWELLSFRSYTFRAGLVMDGESADDEMCMVLLSGSLTMEVAGDGWSDAWVCEGRLNPFEGFPHVVYLPPRHTYRMTVHTDADCCYGRAPATGAKPPRFVTPEQAAKRSGMWQEAHDRYQILQHILEPGDAERLTCFETISPEGGFSRWPEERSSEAGSPIVSARNEVNHYRFEEPAGWGLQRLVTGDGADDEALVVRHGDTVIVRGGSYPVSTAPHSRMYTLTFVAS